MKKIILTIFLVLSLFIYKPSFTYTEEEYLNEMNKYREYYVQQIEETNSEYKKYLNDIKGYISDYNNSIDLLKSQSDNSTCEGYARAQSYGIEQLYLDLVSKCSNNSQNNTSKISEYNSKILELELEYEEIKEERDNVIEKYQLKIDEIDELINEGNNNDSIINNNLTTTSSCGINSYSNGDGTCVCKEGFERADKNDLTNTNCSKIEEYLYFISKGLKSIKEGDYESAIKYYNLSLESKYNLAALDKLSLLYIELKDFDKALIYNEKAKKIAIYGYDIDYLNKYEITIREGKDINNANYLASQGFIVDQSNDPLKYNLGNNVLRQEIAAISLKLGEIDKKNKCDNLFSDLTSIIPNSWACLNIEPLLEKGLISNNKKFRPEENITKTEALGMLIKVKGLDYKLVTNSSKTWQQQIVEYAVREGLVEDFTDYDTYATRAWIFQVVDNIITNDILNSLEGLE